MRHVVLLNVVGHGYTTYAGTSAVGLVEQPLGIPTDLVSESALVASNELNDTLRQPLTPVSIHLRHDPHQRPVVAFGAFYPDVVDDQGRAGLVLVHVLELEEARGLLPVVWGVVELMAAANVAEFGDGVATVAVEDGAVQTFLSGYVTKVEAHIERARERAPVVLPVEVSLGCIEHDCAGAASLAWLLAAHAMTGRAPGWSAYDREHARGVETVVRPEGATRLKISALLDELVQSQIAGGGYLVWLNPSARPSGDGVPSTMIESSRMFTVEKTTVDRMLPTIDLPPEPSPEGAAATSEFAPRFAPEPRVASRGVSVLACVVCGLVGMVLGFVPAWLSRPTTPPPPVECADAGAQAPAPMRAVEPAGRTPSVAPTPPVPAPVRPAPVIDAGGVPVRPPLQVTVRPVRDPNRSRRNHDAPDAEITIR